jgi:hypothetical protein
MACNRSGARAEEDIRRRSAQIAQKMTGEKSRLLKVGNKVCWQKDQADRGTVTETSWSGLTIKWDSRDEQTVLHNDMAQIERAANAV